MDSRQAEQFQAAQKAFDSASKPEEFVKVAAMYYELLEPPTASFPGRCITIWATPGWAKQPGRAIAAYRQAERYLPRDPHLKENLREALKAEPDARRPILETIAFWQNWLSYPEKFYLATVAIAATLFLAVALLFAPGRTLLAESWVLRDFRCLWFFRPSTISGDSMLRAGVTVEADVVAEGQCGEL